MVQKMMFRTKDNYIVIMDMPYGGTRLNAKKVNIRTFLPHMIIMILLIKKMPALLLQIIPVTLMKKTVNLLSNKFMVIHIKSSQVNIKTKQLPLHLWVWHQLYPM